MEISSVVIEVQFVYKVSTLEEEIELSNAK